MTKLINLYSKFDTFVGIDWSGDKNKFQKGISVAICNKGESAPKIIKPSKDKYWSRSSLLSLIKEIKKENNILIGIDFAFSYPFNDGLSYFPGLSKTLSSPKNLWRLINDINKNFDNFYGGGVWKKKPFADYYNSPSFKGKKYQSRRRQTEIDAKNKIHSPSPTFNCVGPGSVGTGSLAGMRFLHHLKDQVSIWPFDTINIKNIILVEIFPTYYFRMAGIKPDKTFGYNLKKINEALKFFECDNLNSNTTINGPDQDDADAIISSAALRNLSKKKEVWDVPIISEKEGWIFGV